MTASTSFELARDETDWGYDFRLGGVLLKDRLRKHERIAVDHVSALGIVKGTRERLLLDAEPDLVGNATALFVCGMCGGYDGNPIGARIRRDGGRVVWEDIGYHYDIEETGPFLFPKVTSFTFDWDQYRRALLAIHVT